MASVLGGRLANWWPPSWPSPIKNSAYALVLVGIIVESFIVFFYDSCVTLIVVTVLVNVLCYFCGYFRVYAARCELSQMSGESGA